MPASRNIRSWQQVDSRQDFAAYLRFLAFDCERASGGQDSEVKFPPDRGQRVLTLRG
ncbi:hypothetical protein [Streptomyces chiangmaiensis]|uniref:hypothetical protein n=1 Tax=Streptomyces chiangmaiensis TaxID=766497 RepID=UPI0031F107D3